MPRRTPPPPPPALPPRPRRPDLDFLSALHGLSTWVYRYPPQSDLREQLSEAWMGQWAQGASVCVEFGIAASGPRDFTLVATVWVADGLWSSGSGPRVEVSLSGGSRRLTPHDPVYSAEGAIHALTEAAVFARRIQAQLDAAD